MPYTPIPLELSPIFWELVVIPNVVAAKTGHAASNAPTSAERMMVVIVPPKVNPES